MLGLGKPFSKPLTQKRAWEEELDAAPVSSRFQPGRTPSVSCLCSSGMAMLLVRDTDPPSDRAGDGGAQRRGDAGRLRVPAMAGSTAPFAAIAAAHTAARPHTCRQALTRAPPPNGCAPTCMPDTIKYTERCVRCALNSQMRKCRHVLGIGRQVSTSRWIGGAEERPCGHTDMYLQWDTLHA